MALGAAPTLSAEGRVRWAAAALVVLGALAAWHASLGQPGLVAIEGWFYRPTHPGLRLRPLVGAFGLAALALAVTAFRARSRWVVGLCLFSASLATQLAFIAMSADGLATYWTRLSGGHGEFLRVAHARTSVWATLRGYEGLVAADALGHFPPSKPPGALALYFAVDRLGEALRGPLGGWVADAAASRVGPGPAAGAALALGLFPVLTALASPLTAGLTWALGGRTSAGVAAGLALAASPSTLLITHHLDGAVYPLFAVGVAWAWVAAARSPRLGAVWATVGGGLLVLGAYTSFSLLPAGLLAALLGLGVWVRERGVRRVDGGDALIRIAAAAVGAAVVLAGLGLALAFEPLARFEGAMAHHEAWKAGVPTTLWRFAAPLEFFAWLGWPLVAVWLWSVGPRLRPPHPDTSRWVGRVSLAVLLLLSAAAGTNEVARLWMFLAPFACVSVGLAHRWRGLTVGALVTAQLAAALALRAVGPW